ncbi:hypothetical protein BSKO_04243 [Bryopsis sp. KO-2023]|nr:hypothetical protein BSKO_04243 [Bryopsis sp. KO-2023]
MLDELLSGFEESEIVSGSALREALQRLTAEERKLKQALYSYAQEVFAEVPPRDDSLEMFENVLKEVSDGEEKERNKTNQLLQDVKEYRIVKSDLQRLQLSQNAKKVSALLEKQLSEFDEHIAQGRFSDAGWCILGLHKSLEQHGVVGTLEDKDLTPDLIALAQRVEAGKSTLHKVLADGLSKAICVSPSQYYLTVGSDLTSEVWKGLEVMGGLEPAIEEIVGNVFKDGICPILESTLASIDFRVDTNGSGGARFEWQATNSTREGPQGLPGKLKAVEGVLKHLSEHLFQRIGSLLQIAGEKLQCRLDAAILHQVKSEVESMEAVAALGYLELVSDSVKSFSQALQHMGYHDNEEGTSLCKAISDLAQQHLKAFPIKYLSQARGLLISPNWDGVQVGVPLAVDSAWLARQMKGGLEEWEMEDPATGLDFEKYVAGKGQFKVSGMAVAVLELMRKAMNNACKEGSSLIFHSICRAIEDMAVMYCSLPPTLHSSQLEVPEISMLFSNDCFYLSDQLLMLPHMMSIPDGFEPSAGKIDFLNVAQRLRIAGRTTMEHQVARQREALLEVVNRVNSFTGLRTGQQGIAMRRSAMQLSQLMARLGRVIGDVMAVSDQVALASLLMEDIASQIVGSLMGQTDITLQESEELPKILQPISCEMPAAILSISEELLKTFKVKSTDGGSDVANAESNLSWLMWRVFCEHCPSLLKLEKLMEIFEARLAAIVEWWEAGELQRTGFSGSEVRRLIYALFEHSDWREECIAKIC